MARGGSGAAAGGSFHGREAFSPAAIVGQLAALQGALYAGGLAFALVFDYVLGVPLRSRDGRRSILAAQLLDGATPSLRTSAGVIAGSAFYFAVLFVVPPAFAYLVGRSRRALDYLCSVLLLHFVLCSAYGGVPTSSTWWFMLCSGGIATVLIAEVLSRRLELREIAVPDRDAENPSPDTDEDAVRPA